MPSASPDQLAPLSPALFAAATGRTHSLFQPDIDAAAATLAAAIAGKRVLVIGGAGSIGSAVTVELADLKPAALHVIDHSENGLVELVRHLRSRPVGLEVADFQTLPLDYGAPVTGMFLRAQAPYDAIFNFAALKHVRSEKDVFSLLQMLDTNLCKQVRFMGWLRDLGHASRYFCVSTDKAANPVSLMGSSKRLMEHVLFSEQAVPGLRAVITSARFANVAFSDGSLLQGFLNRLAKRQPLAAPRDTKRYFVSFQEAAQICLLAALTAPGHSIVVPKLDPSKDLVDLQAVAERVLRHFGFEPAYYDDEAAARHAVAAEMDKGRYPLLLTPLDTGGEKPYEEFVGLGEEAFEIGLKTLRAVPYLPPPPDSLGRLLEVVSAAVRGERGFVKSELVEAIKGVIPHLAHADSGRNLDQRM